MEQRAIHGGKEILISYYKSQRHRRTLLSLFQTFLQVIGVVGVAVAVIPWMAIPLVLLGILFFVLRSYFLETSRDVKRLESTSEYRGPRWGGSAGQLPSTQATITDALGRLQTGPQASSRSSHSIPEY